MSWGDLSETEHLGRSEDDTRRLQAIPEHGTPPLKDALKGALLFAVALAVCLAVIPAWIHLCLELVKRSWDLVG